MLPDLSVVAGRFEVIGLAGSGGMGSIYRAIDRETGDPVAIKVLRDARGADRFGLEARVLAELSHPGIVRYVAHGQLPTGELFLVMEWLDGQDLGARLAQVGLSVSESVAFLRRACEALSVAHAHGVVHRDLKP